MGSFLKGVFTRNAALFGGAVLMAAASSGCSTFAGHNLEILLSPGTPLSEGEKEFAYGIFGDQLNISSIRKHAYDDGCGKKETGLISAGNNIASCNEKNYAEDYSRASSALKAKFAHETVHVWQFQMLLSQTNGLCTKDDTGETVYLYDTKKKKFSDYCHEQQGAIIEDYTLRFLIPPRTMTIGAGATDEVTEASRWNKMDTPETDLFLQKIVEGQFPQARKTRLALKALNP